MILYSVSVVQHRHCFQAVLVPTAETIRIRFFLDLLMKKKTPVMLVGGAGCGKTVLVNEKLQT